MTAITPQTDVILLKCPLELNDENQLTFANATAQYNYFNGLTGKLTVGTDFTYQRKDGTMRVGQLMDNIIGYNYLMYRNEGFSNKWFYAFITDMKYVNNNTTELTIKTDVFQTWQFDLTYKQTFVEREHVNDVTIGTHTIDEGLEVGEYMINSSTNLAPDKLVKDDANNILTSKYFYVFQVTSLPGVFAQYAADFSDIYNGVFSGIYFFGVADANNAAVVINYYATQNRGADIMSIFMAPKEYFDGSHYHQDTGGNFYIPKENFYTDELLPETTITRPTKLNGYTPKNNKMFVYPYSYMYLTNNVGSECTFRYEDFASATPKFSIRGSLVQGCSTKLVPISYKNIGSGVEAFDYGLAGAKYPICAWVNDYYTNWLTQNAVNQPTQVVGTLLSAGANYAMGNPIGVVSSVFNGVTGVMNQRYQAKVHPDQGKGNLNQSDIMVPWERYFTLDCMSVRAEVAKCIDDYFSAFGYKVNSVKVPNITGRRNWNFVKTVGCYIEADIPQGDIAEIKDMFDKGVTLWHNPATFCDYSQLNDIIS